MSANALPRAEMLLGTTEQLDSFVRHQIFRARFRANILWRGLKSGIFWTIFIGVSAYLVDLGLAIVAVAAVCLWLFLAWTAVRVQVRLIADLVTAFVFKTVRTYPSFANALLWYHINTEFCLRLGIRPRKPPLYSRARQFAGDVSPLAPLAVWGLVVLLRIPFLTVWTLNQAQTIRKEVEARFAKTKKRENRRRTHLRRMRNVYDRVSKKHPNAMKLQAERTWSGSTSPWAASQAGDEVLDEMLAAV